MNPPSAEVTRALVRRPSPLLADGIVTHIERTEVDAELALRQWIGYVEALRQLGWDIIEVPPADECPDGVFVEDALVMFRGQAILTNPGDPRRVPEVESVARVVTRLGLPVLRIEAPGTIDGGDVLKVGDTVYVGCGGRTNEEGLRQFEAHVAPLGGRVVPVAITRVLHLKSAVTALPDGTVIGWPDLVDDVDVFERFLAVPESSGAHVVLTGRDQVLMADDAPQSASLFRSLGYAVVAVPISEFEKLEGCVTCLSVRIRSL